MAGVITPRTKPGRIEWLKQLLDTTIEKNQVLWETPRTYFRASSVGNPCDRCLELDMFGHRIPFDAKTLRIFETGNSIEDVVLSTLAGAGVLMLQLHPQLLQQCNATLAAAAAGCRGWFCYHRRPGCADRSGRYLWPAAGGSLRVVS